LANTYSSCEKYNMFKIKTGKIINKIKLY